MPEQKETPRQFRDRMRSVGYLARGRSHSSTSREYRHANGVRVKETIDQAGNSVIEHDTKDDRVDVVIRPQSVVYGTNVTK